MFCRKKAHVGCDFGNGRLHAGGEEILEKVAQKAMLPFRGVVLSMSSI